MWENMNSIIPRWTQIRVQLIKGGCDMLAIKETFHSPFDGCTGKHKPPLPQPPTAADTAGAISNKDKVVRWQYTQTHLTTHVFQGINTANPRFTPGLVSGTVFPARHCRSTPISFPTQNPSFRQQTQWKFFNGIWGHTDKLTHFFIIGAQHARNNKVKKRRREQKYVTSKSYIFFSDRAVLGNAITRHYRSFGNEANRTSWSSGTWFGNLSKAL